VLFQVFFVSTLSCDQKTLNPQQTQEAHLIHLLLPPTSPCSSTRIRSTASYLRFSVHNFLLGQPRRGGEVKVSNAVCLSVSVRPASRCARAPHPLAPPPPVNPPSPVCAGGPTHTPNVDLTRSTPPPIDRFFLPVETAHVPNSRAQQQTQQQTNHHRSVASTFRPPYQILLPLSFANQTKWPRNSAPVARACSPKPSVPNWMSLPT
jgi:hypothetical protein